MTGLSVNPLQISGRRPQDMWASILFALFFAATIGITCVKGSSLKNLAASCTDSEGNLRSVGLRLGAPEDTNSTAEIDDLVEAGPYLIGTAAFALLFVSIWMVLLRYFAKHLACRIAEPKELSRALLSYCLVAGTQLDDDIGPWFW